ncbi:ribonuclease Z [Bacillus sp. FJAT-45037]|uniref:ribonuclease Z n=1 Tax=Bacillus sp. FJAT-45037 TaxID=2011007 RepID=UPI000C23D139|nr:ribonuclease Z [Bacillus sp. FJAT-45037]
MEFHFLGTGSGVPAIERNVSAMAIRFLQQKGTQWLFDCGEATQHQLLRSPITMSKIDRIFITHLHGDHIFGLPGLLGSRSFQGAQTSLKVYGPKGLKNYIEASLSVSRTHLRYDYQVIEVEEGCLFETNDVTVHAMELDHVMPSYAYKIIEKDKPGTLNVEKLQSLEIPKGPIYQRIKAGEVIELENGVIINGQNFLGPSQKGRTIVVAGDTRPVRKLVDFAKHATLLIHEATFRSDKASHAEQFGHSTIEGATAIARAAEVDHLVLTHISSRYTGEEEEFLKEARHYFQPVDIAADLMVFTLK